MKEEVVGWETPKWDALFVVCKDCRRRKNGPEASKPRKLVRTIRSHSREAGRRPRAVMSGCLGLCPKGATAIAFAGRDSELRVVAVESAADLESVLSRLEAPQAP
jgi:predicted metal-binding protein